LSTLFIQIHDDDDDLCLQHVCRDAARRVGSSATADTHYRLDVIKKPRGIGLSYIALDLVRTRMWANAQRDGRPAEYRWRPLFNAATFGRRPLPECRAVPRRETR